MIGHNFPIHYEWQTQSAKVLALPQERAHQESNDTPQPISEFQSQLPFTVYQSRLI